MLPIITGKPAELPIFHIQFVPPPSSVWINSGWITLGFMVVGLCGIYFPEFLEVIAHKFPRPEIVGFVQGLLYGGFAWLYVALVTILIHHWGRWEEFAATILRFYREHAFDILGAGAVIAGLVYFINNQSLRTRRLGLGAGFLVVAALTATTADGSAIEIIVAASCGAYCGVLWGLEPSSFDFVPRLFGQETDRTES